MMVVWLDHGSYLTLSVGVGNPAAYKHDFFPPILFFASSLLRHHFYFTIDTSIALPTTTITTKDERRRTNGKTRPSQLPVHLLLTMTNKLPFTLFIFLSALDSLRR
jgi:hypothetical protein